MIRIWKAGMCEGCKLADIQLKELFHTDGIVWIAQCTHERACKDVLMRHGYHLDENDEVPKW